MLGLCSFGLFSFGSGDFPYTEYWKKVDTYLAKQQPQSALDVVLEIYDQAKKDEAEPHILRSIITQNRIATMIEEVEIADIIQRMEADIESVTNRQVQACLQSATASMYLYYLQQNYYRLNDRITLGTLPEDQSLWSISDIEARADELMLSSLDLTDVKDRSLQDYGLVEETDLDFISLHPYLIQQGIYFFQNDISYMSSVVDESIIDQATAFRPVYDFVKDNIDSKLQRARRKDNVIILYQKLLSYYKNEVFIQSKMDIQRLQYARQKYLQGQESNVTTDLYTESLDRAYATAKNGDQKAIYGYYLASAYMQIGDSYARNYDADYSGFNLKAYNLLKTLAPNDKKIKNSIDGLIYQMTIANIELTIDEVVVPNVDFPVKVDFKNVTNLHFKLTKLNVDEYIEYFINYGQDKDKNRNALLRKQSVREWTVSLDIAQDYQRHSTEYVMKGLESGQYVLFIGENANFKPENGQTAKYALFQVSNQHLRNWTTIEGNTIQILNKSKGNPLENVNVEITEVYYGNQDVTQSSTTLTTDNAGKITINSPKKNRRNQRLLSTIGEDKLVSQFYPNNYYDSSRSRVQAYTFMDRSIYRPGQTAKGKVLLINYDQKSKPNILSNTSIELILKDANYQVISTKSIDINDSGAGEFRFEIPSSGLKGRYTIEISHQNSQVASTHIQVEEYRRPTIEGLIDSSSDYKKLGDTVDISGIIRSMSGFPSQGAKVHYTISEQAYIVWRGCGWSSRWYPPYQSAAKVVGSGQTVTDEAGKFTVSVGTDTNNMKSYQKGKTYIIRLDVTDQGGESLSLTKTIHLTPAIYRVKHTIPQVLSLDTDFNKLSITGINFDNNPVEVNSKILIKKYLVPSEYFKNRSYKLDHLLYTEEQFQGYKTFFQPSSIEESFDPSFEMMTVDVGDLLETVKNLPSGEFQFEIVADYEGEEVKQLHRCLVTKDDRVSPSKLLYTDANQQQSEVGSTYKPNLLFHPEVSQVYYFKLRKNTIIKEGWLSRKEALKLQFKIATSDQGGFTLHFSAALKGDVENVRINVDVPYVDTYANLDLKLDSILMPGTDYNIDAIATVDGKPLKDGNVTLVMYDAALDEIYPHQWSASFYPSFYSNLYFSDIGTGRGQVHYIGRYQNNTRYNSYIQLEVIPRAQWYGIAHLSGRNINYLSATRSGASPRMAKTMDASAPQAAEMAADTNMAENTATGYSTAQDDDSSIDTPPVPRSDFGETVFFITDGKMDNKGEYSLPFKTNDALTKWKVLAFVHDKEMRYGLAEKTIRTKKDIQIIQTPTRLLYEGDKIEWPITVQNSTDRIVEGQASISIKSYLTQEDITDQFITADADVSMSIDGMGSQNQTFRLVVPNNFKDQIEIVTAFKSSIGSDAEARVVPVLTTEQFLTAGHPIWAGPNMYEELIINPSTDQETTSLRIELVSNPFWLVARSFPMLSDRNMKVSTNVSENIYIESVANQIVTDFPSVERAFASKAITSEKTGLSRNNDVKVQELNSTPWVRQSARAETRTADFAKYFNANESTERLKQLKAKLKMFQNGDGGYSWIQGGRSSLYTTQRILLDLARLYEMTISDQIIVDRASTQRALDYIDSEIRKSRKNWTKDSVNMLMLQDLYLHAILGDNYQSPLYHKQWLSTLEQKWSNLQINEQALAGLIFLKEGMNDSATAVKTSLEERAITRDDGTIFWRGINEYYAYTNAYGTQALVISFMKAAEADATLIDSAVQWLLANKRSNEWYNDRATADVVQMLYKVYGTEMYETPNIVISLNGNRLDMEKSLTFHTIDLEPRDYSGELSITVNNGEQYPVFGGVYHQFFQPLESIVQHQSGKNLSIKKSIYVKQMKDNKVIFEPIAEGDVSVGDELTIRLEIEAFDRMQYVYISDVRPANTEPADRISGHDYRNGLYLYQSPSDIGQEFFVQTLPKGVHTLEYSVKVLQSGEVSSGLAEVQSFYVPEFSAYDVDGKVKAGPLSDD